MAEDVVDRRIESLREPAQTACRTWLHICKDDLGIDARILETLRPEARQIELWKAGKSQIKIGWHNVGLAWDFGVFENGRYLTDDKSGLYLRCGLVAEALNCVWGGRWDRLKDLGHCEFHPGFTLRQFLDGQKGGLVAT